MESLHDRSRGRACRVEGESEVGVQTRPVREREREKRLSNEPKVPGAVDSNCH